MSLKLSSRRLLMRYRAAGLLIWPPGSDLIRDLYHTHAEPFPRAAPLTPGFPPILPNEPQTAGGPLVVDNLPRLPAAHRLNSEWLLAASPVNQQNGPSAAVTFVRIFRKQCQNRGSIPRVVVLQLVLSPAGPYRCRPLPESRPQPRPGTAPKIPRDTKKHFLLE